MVGVSHIVAVALRTVVTVHRIAVVDIADLRTYFVVASLIAVTAIEVVDMLAVDKGVEARRQGVEAAEGLLRRLGCFEAQVTDTRSCMEVVTGMAKKSGTAHSTADRVAGQIVEICASFATVGRLRNNSQRIF